MTILVLVVVFIATCAVLVGIKQIRERFTSLELKNRWYAGQLDELRTTVEMPSIVTADIMSALTARLLLLRAAQNSAITIVVTGADQGMLDDITELLLANVPYSELCRPKVTRRPGMVRFPNGSQVLVRAYGRDGKGMMGVYAVETVWWLGDPAELDTTPAGTEARMMVVHGRRQEVANG